MSFLNKQINVHGSCFRAGFKCLSGGGGVEKDVFSHLCNSCVLAKNVTQSPEAFGRVIVHDGFLLGIIDISTFS